MTTKCQWASAEMDLGNNTMIIPNLLKIEWIDVYFIISDS